MEAVKKLKIAPWLAYGVRDAMQDAKGPLYIATPYGTRLDGVSTAMFHAAPDELARFGFAVARALDSRAPAAQEQSQDWPLANEIAHALKAAKRPLVISGTSCASHAVIQAAANVAMAAGAALSFTAPECNSLGAALMGGNSLSAAFQAVRDGSADTIIILENDLYRRAARADVDSVLKAAPHVIVLDHLSNPTAEKAELVLPAGTFAESDGTFISSEGRAQRFFQVRAPDSEILASWRWLKPDRWQNLDHVLQAMADALPQLAAARDAAPSSRFRIAGAKIPRSPHRESGRTSALVNIDISEPKTPDDPDSALSFSMEGAPDQPPAALIPFFWSPSWNSIQAVNTYQKEIGGPLRGGDAGVRLFEPTPGNGPAYFSAVPSAFNPRAGEWLLVPMYHIFGSDELSLSAPAIRELAAKPHVAMNCDEFAEGVEVEVTCSEGTFRLPVRIHREMPAGVAALSVGAGPFVGMQLPAWGKIARAK